MPETLRFQGKPVDAHGRCVHWHGPADIVSYRFACCEGWWPCHDCHEQTASHRAVAWPTRQRPQEPAVLCGACGHAMTVARYVASGSRCPGCGSAFNPACKAHWPRYFQTP